MPSDAAYQAFWGSSVLIILCVPLVHYNVLFIYVLGPTNLLVAWRVCGCREKAYMIFKYVYHEIPRQHYSEFISNRLVGHTCK